MCPNHPEVTLKKQSVADILSCVEMYSDGEKFAIISPIPSDEELKTVEQIKEYVIQKGFVRFMIDTVQYTISDTVDSIKDWKQAVIVVDRFVYIKESFDIQRFKDSCELAFQLGEDAAGILQYETHRTTFFYRKSTCPHCQYSLQDLTISNFSFNSHYGACTTCHGL
jgi:excinuclease ABC subunit A